MRPEVALLYSGVGLDVLGKGFDQFPSDLREQIVAKYPRKHFKEDFILAYFAGFAHKPGTTYGTVNAGVCERYIPGYVSIEPPVDLTEIAADPQVSGHAIADAILESFKEGVSKRAVHRRAGREKP